MSTVFISLDDFFSLNAWPEYRNLIKTPNIDAFASQSSVFDNAFAPVALCNPSRSSVLSGLAPWTSGVVDNNSYLFNHVDPSRTLPGLLKSAGVEVAIGGKMFHTLPDDTSLMADEILSSGGFRNGTSVEGTRVGGLDYGTVEAGTLSDDRLATSAAQFFSSDHDTFFLALGIYRPHVDWVVPQEFFDLYDRSDIPVPDFNDTSEFSEFGEALAHGGFHEAVLDEEAWVDLIHAYLAAVSYADYVFGRMINALEASDHADTTDVIVWSDHGYHLGDKEYWHKFTLWEEAGRAPLIIREAGQETGKVITAPVSLTDIFATTLDLAGVDVPADTDSNSLLPLMRGGDATTKGVLTWLYGSFSLRTAEFRYIRYEDGSEELYDIVVDVHQTNNLAGDPTHAGDLAVLRQEATAQLTANNIFTGSGTLVGTPDDDVFLPVEGGQTLVGGNGDDTYVLRPGTLATTTILDTGGIDTIFGNREILIQAGIENFSTRDRTAAAQIFGNVLNNLLNGGADDDHLYGEDGNDTLFGGPGNDLLSGGTGADELRDPTGDNEMLGGAGNDQMFGGSGADLMAGGTGNDQILAHSGNDRLYGADGNDYLDGGPGDNLVVGGSGDDFLSAEGGIDTLEGGAGKDTIRGGDGNDSIDGSWGNDHLGGGAGNDTILTGGGWNTVIGGTGNDLIETGSNGWSSVAGGSGEDTILSNGDTLHAHGHTGNDVLEGADQDDRLRGGAGDDTINGGAGNDYIYGGDNNDIVDGGAGQDTLSGGEGADIFRFSGIEHSEPGAVDMVLDFANPGPGGAGDLLDLSAIDANTGIPGNQNLLYGGSEGNGPLTMEVGYFWFVNNNSYTILNANIDTQDDIDLRISIDDGVLLASAYTEHDVIV